MLVLTEVDCLTRDAQAALRRTMEKYSGSCRLVMLCNSLCKVIEPVRSRCLAIRVPAPTHEQVCSSAPPEMCVRGRAFGATALRSLSGGVVSGDRAERRGGHSSLAIRCDRSRAVVAHPLPAQICAVLTKVCKREQLKLPPELALRVAKASRRNLRVALLSLEACKIQSYPFQPDQARALRPHIRGGVGG